MSQNKSTSTINNGAGNKDLSCLRCRKKKAKCSKTRPACTRCARSNQPCEYPDAPPNLTDLSQKVLSLYDTLRELEDKFMLQYVTQEQEQEITAKTGEKRRRQSSSSINSKSPLDDMPSIESLSLLNPIIKRPRRQNQQQLQQQQSLPGNWSMSLTSHGLSLHAVARNMIEFSSFAKDFSQQLRNNDPENKLTKSWEWYEEESMGDEYDDDPLDEDEYLVTVPVYSLPSLLDYHTNDNNNNNNFILNNNKNNISNTINNVNDDEEEDDDDDDTPYYNRIRPLLDDLMNYLRQTYNILSMDQFPIHLYHIITLLQQLRPFIPFDQKSLSTNKHENPIQLVCTTTAYAASIQLLSSTHQPSQSTQLVNDCIHYATSMLIELVFQQQQEEEDNINPSSLPIVSCAALLSWMGKSEMAHLATRTMYGSDDWDENNDQWRHLAASLLYHQVYSMTFSSSLNQKNHYEIIGEAEIWLLRSAKQLSQQKQTENTSSIHNYFYGSALGLETELVCLLKQVFGLFYDMENQNENKNIRKVDVDDVLKLVQNIEAWEHQLPKWVQWSSVFTLTETRWLKLKMHIHLIHNIVKILLYRPFSIEPFQQQAMYHEKMKDGQKEEQVQLNGNDLLQTHTRTTFLDLSLAAADRATLCIRHLHDDTHCKMDNHEDAWVRAGDCLSKDVIRRVKEAFPCDDELFIIIQGIENRFIEKEVIKPSSLPL
ncbi:hypothetical protein INT45_005821 [Circinella minor]|uniref:Zn(2)-C6 fungal-type domain-containing protein n=1 Tax=Circinella minor TaxID=1195481 RepID=A0A8H7RYP8_9FUNG|nr:hypothetical protein INT45_005821 [Circinella minor]